MLCLGFGGSNHDFAACLVRDGVVRAAVEEERLTRTKHAVGVNSMFIDCWKYCLDSEGVELADVDAIVADDTLLAPAYFRFRSKVQLIRHHYAHAASAFYASPFESAAILIADGAGSLVDEGVETLTTGVGNGSEITELSKVYGVNWGTDNLSPDRIYQAGDSDHSLGFMYKAVSRAIGFVMYEEGDWFLTEDGKTMGLAPYGSDTFYERFRQHVNLLPDGRFEIRMKDGGLLDEIDEATREFEVRDRFAVCADLAWAGQAVLEEVLVHVALRLYEETRLTNLCVAGGVALNSVANGKVLEQTPFEDVFIQPAAGDAGCAIGCALHAYHGVCGEPRRFHDGSPRWSMRHAYLGRRYPKDHAIAAVEAAGLPYERVDDAAGAAARALAAGALVGWFQGASEFGPRALGHRSILADPRDPGMKDFLNKKVKHREWFRPFAPAVLREHLGEYFELDVDSPFMLLVARVVEDKKGVIPSVVHVDGTARVQTVDESNDAFRTLVERFYELTGVPVVLNTSFNDKGEPIVEIPEEAVRFFAASELDYLVIEDLVVAHDEAALARITGSGAGVGAV